MGWMDWMSYFVNMTENKCTYVNKCDTFQEAEKEKKLHVPPVIFIPKLETTKGMTNLAAFIHHMLDSDKTLQEASSYSYNTLF